MSVKKIDIFGLTFAINMPSEEEEIYRDIAGELDRKIRDDVASSELRSDLRSAIRVAFLLALENRSLKSELQKNADKVDKLLSV